MKSFTEYIQENCISLNQYICEHYVNLFDAKDMRKYSKEVWDMISKAYEYIGGVAGCPDYETFVKFYCDSAEQEKFMWKMVIRSGKVTAIKIYTRKRGGRKGIIIASDGTEQGKKDIMKILNDDYNLKDRQSWDEVSGKALGSALKQGAVPLPNTVISQLMPDKKITPLEDGWFYRRKLGDKEHIKLLVGYPPTGDTAEVDDELKAKLKELSKKYEQQEH